MQIPENFAFSQNNLQDFEECPRRFELRHLERLAWPAIRSEPVLALERHMLLGERFHRMIQQHQSGLAAEVVGAAASEPELVEWWQAYLDHFPAELPENRRIEYTLAAPFNGYRLVAKFDLLAVDPGKKMVILDWKTSLKKPGRAILQNRLQTRLYPFLLAKAGKIINGGLEPQPDQIEMIYWFTAEPHAPEHFYYSSDQYRVDGDYFDEMLRRVIDSTRTGFPLTDDLRQCRFCNYRSLCERGAAAGKSDPEALNDLEGEQPIDLDFDQIGEIAY